MQKSPASRGFFVFLPKPKPMRELLYSCLLTGFMISGLQKKSNEIQLNFQLFFNLSLNTFLNLSTFGCITYEQ